MSASIPECVEAVLEVVPFIMQILRENVRKQSGPEMTIPQLRALAFIARNDGARLSEVAWHIGLTLPSTSKLVDGLVDAGFAKRKSQTEDRRCVALALTRPGKAKYTAALDATREFLGAEFIEYSAKERLLLIDAMQLLQRTFARDRSHGQELSQKKKGEK